MLVDRIGEVFMYVGVLGLFEFAALAFAARQVEGMTSVRLRRKMSSYFVRRAPSLVMLSGAIVLAGGLLAVRPS